MADDNHQELIDLLDDDVFNPEEFFNVFFLQKNYSKKN